jgi:hypothetical protein
MYYEFQTQVGRFIIRSDPDNPGQALLSIDNVDIGKYESAAAGWKNRTCSTPAAGKISSSF